MVVRWRREAYARVRRLIWARGLAVPAGPVGAPGVAAATDAAWPLRPTLRLLIGPAFLREPLFVSGGCAADDWAPR